MGGSYRQCAECGKRALSIATRCPGCGRELPAPAGPESGTALELGRFVSPVALAAVLAAVAVLTADGLVREPSFTPADSIAASTEVAYAIAASPRLDTASAGERLVARTWTNVRTRRSRSAGLEALLTPGDTVLADSLDRGWYRVALEGEVLGYVHRSTLTAPRSGH